MIYVVPPEIESVRNSLVMKYLRQIARRLRCLERSLSRCDDDPTVMPERMQWPVGKPGQEPCWVIEKTVLVRVAAEI